MDTEVLVDLSPSALRQHYAMLALVAVAGPLAWLTTFDLGFALLAAVVVALPYLAALWMNGIRSVEGDAAHSELRVRMIIGPARSVLLGPGSRVGVYAQPVFGRPRLELAGSNGSSLKFDAKLYDPRRLLAFCERVPGVVVEPST